MRIRNMQFDKSTVIDLLGQDAYDRLVDKLGGGKANGDGFEYELYNCAYEIIEHAYAYATDEPVEPNVYAYHPGEVTVQQGAFAFVDDILVDTPEISVFYQIKHVEKLAWTPDLQFDFDCQKDLMDTTSRQYRLVLVTHLKERFDALKDSNSQYVPDNAWVYLRPTSRGALLDKIKKLMLCVQSERNASLIQWQVELAWMKGPRTESVLTTLERASEFTRGALITFAPTNHTLANVIAEIEAENVGSEILKLSADGRTIQYHLRWDDDEFEGFVRVEDWCAFERALAREKPSTARELIMMAMHGDGD